MNLKNKKYLIIVALFIIIIGMWYSINHQNKYYDKKTNTLFENYLDKEVNYMFFEEGDKKIITIDFPENIDKYDFETSKLYFGGELVDGDYDVIRTDESKLQIILHNYITEFDRVSVKYKNKEVIIFTGKYFFENIPNWNTDNTLDYRIVKANSIHKDQNYSTKFTLNKAYKGDISIKIPSKVLTQNLVEIENLTSEDNVNYNYGLTLNNTSLQNYDLEKITFESMLILEDKSNTNFITLVKNKIEFKH